MNNQATQKPYLDTAATFFEPHPQASAQDALWVAFQLLEQAESTADTAADCQTYNREVQGLFFALLTHIQLARKALNHVDKLNMALAVAKQTTPPPCACCCNQEEQQQDKFAKAVGMIALEAVTKHLAQNTTSQ